MAENNILVPPSQLPPLDSSKLGTIFLDLDETLIHSADYPLNRYDFMIGDEIDGELQYFFVWKRPEVDQFLEVLSKKFELVIFTSGTKDYASKVLDVLDPKGRISHRLFRDSCGEVEGNCVKDLAATGRDLRKSVIIDDKPEYYSLQQENGIPIKPFEGYMKDRQLLMLVKFFQELDDDQFDDLRKAVAMYRKRWSL